MSEQFATAQDAEDAFYDAIDDRDADRLKGVWEKSPDIACLLPMQPLIHGDKVHSAWTPMFDAGLKFDLQVRHIRWLEMGDLAIHYVGELVSVPGQPQQPPLFATNIYRKGEEGWRIILHQNSPTPPPPEAIAAGAAPPKDLS